MQYQKTIYKFIVLIFLAAILGFTSGCSTQGKSVGLGGTLGAGGGALIGGVLTKNGEYRTRNIIIGAAAGGILGSLTGAAIHDNTEKEKEISYLKGRESKQNDSRKGVMPPLQNPKVESQWVESKVIGNRYIEGHFEYIITEPTRWEAVQ